MTHPVFSSDAAGTFLERINGCWGYVIDTYEHWLTLRHVAGPILLGCAHAIAPGPCPVPPAVQHASKPPESFVYYPPQYVAPALPPSERVRIVYVPVPIGTPVPAPEPSGALVLVIGAAGAVLVRRHSQKDRRHA